MFGSLRRATLPEKTASRPRRRALTARTPRLEPLERREMPATLTFPQTDVPTFTASFLFQPPFGGEPVPVSGRPVSGGNFLGQIDTTPLVASYCVNINQSIDPSFVYRFATATSDGTVYGAPVPRAESIAWLVSTFGPSATNVVQQDALQAAIWRVEYGTALELDGVDNTNGAPQINETIAPAYRAYLAALGTNTAPVNSVAWISPGPDRGGTLGQGIVAVLGTSGPGPGPGPGPTVNLPHVSGIAATGRSRKGVTEYTVTFDQVMSPAAANGALYHVSPVTIRGGRPTFGKPLGIRSVRQSASDAVTIQLARPRKGPVQVVVSPGVPAANGAATLVETSIRVR